jgi:hypothetical protein
MKIDVSTGEIVDKTSILEIKLTSIKNLDKLKNIKNEYDYLLDIMVNDLKIDKQSDDYSQLYSINKKLWDIEDLLRLKEFKKEFDEEFIDLARKVYFTNDKRAELKKNINEKYNSLFVEEKSYEKY